MMINCENVQRLLSEYSSDALSRRKRRAIERHLGTCEDCRHEMRTLDAVLDLVDSNVPDYEPPAGLWHGVYNRITAPQARPTALGTIVGQWLAKPVRAVGVGAAVLALIVGGILGTTHQQSTPELSFAAADNTYVQAHALNASRAPLADRVSYISLVAISEPQTESEQR